MKSGMKLISALIFNSEYLFIYVYISIYVSLSVTTAIDETYGTQPFELDQGSANF